MSTSSWWSVVQQYYQTSSGSKSFVGTISLGGSNVDASYALGKAISGTDKSATIVQNVSESA